MDEKTESTGENGSNTEKSIEAASPLFKKIGKEIGGKIGEDTVELLGAALMTYISDNPAALIGAIVNIITEEEDPTTKLLKEIEDKVNEILVELKEVSDFIKDNAVFTQVENIESSLETIIGLIKYYEANSNTTAPKDAEASKLTLITSLSTYSKDVKNNVKMLSGYVTDDPAFEIGNAFVCKAFFLKNANNMPIEEAAKRVACYFSRINKAFFNAAKIGLLIKLYNPFDDLLDTVNTSYESYQDGLSNHFGCLAEIGSNYLTNSSYIPFIQLSESNSPENLSIIKDFLLQSISLDEFNKLSLENQNQCKLQIINGGLYGTDSQMNTPQSIGTFDDNIVVVDVARIQEKCWHLEDFNILGQITKRLNLIRVHNIKKTENRGANDSTMAIMVSVCVNEDDHPDCLDYDNSDQFGQLEYEDDNGYGGTSAPKSSQLYFLEL
jgi:hypothetical protein